MMALWVVVVGQDVAAVVGDPARVGCGGMDFGHVDDDVVVGSAALPVAGVSWRLAVPAALLELEAELARWPI